ncbi:MAG: peptidoglycan DD-metalloendopeptidase family protein [Anaerolineae bacterium]
MAGSTASPHITLTRLAYQARAGLSSLTRNEALFSRSSGHLIVILLAVLAISLSNLRLTWGSIRALRPSQLVPAAPAVTTSQEETVAPLTLPIQLTDLQNDILIPAAVPRTIIPERAREEISTYQVESGDTIYGIAAKFGLDPETVIWSNPDLEKAPDILSIGQELRILPVNGVYHQVGQGDTLDKIASTFKVDVSAILNYPLNQLNPDNPVITTGEWLVVPGGSKPFIPRTVTAYTGEIPADASVGTGAFDWPASGTIYQGYFPWHPAIDIAAYIGAPVLAADSGYVIVSGWDNSGYGYHVVIDHSDGYQTLYAHMNAIYVETGQSVAKGQQLGEMGNTGNATGPHLHFEVRQGTVQRNPVGFLP